MAVALASVLLAGVLVVIGAGTPASADNRICSGGTISGVFAGNEQHYYVMYVPSGATVTTTGTVEITARDTTGGWQSLVDLNFDGERSIEWFIGSYYGGPGVFPVSDTWVNNGASRDSVVWLENIYGVNVVYNLTLSVSGGAQSPACVPAQGASASEMLGFNAAAPLVCKTYGCAADPVNTLTGNFHQTFSDFSIPARGPGLQLTRSYNSMSAATDGPLGWGWTFNYGMSLTQAGNGNVTIRQETGSQVTFTPSGSTYTAPSYVAATLVRNADSTWTFKRRGGETLTFTSAGKLSSIRDANGYSTTLAYDTKGKLATATDSAGRKLTFVWTSGTTSRIDLVRDFNSPIRTVDFSYDGTGHLTSVLDVGAGTTVFPTTRPTACSRCRRRGRRRRPIPPRARR